MYSCVQSGSAESTTAVEQCAPSPRVMG